MTERGHPIEITSFDILYTFFWQPRSGGRHSIGEIRASSFEAARSFAMERGYPGHKGGWWNYFVDDTHALLVRLGLTKERTRRAK